MTRQRLTLIVVVLALVVPAAAAFAGTAPTLGLKQTKNHWGAGFGAVRPASIDFNGDPTSFIDKIHWSSWGASQAVGQGVAGFVWPGFGVADGTRYVAATVVAFDLGTCGGHPAYQREEWYFPQYGETFAESSAYWNVCTGKSLDQKPPAGPLYCPKGQLTTWVAGGVTCDQLPGIEGLVDGDAHRGHSAKWISHGWICGTDPTAGSHLQTVTCQSGNAKGVNFAI